MIPLAHLLYVRYQAKYMSHSISQMQNLSEEVALAVPIVLLWALRFRKIRQLAWVSG
jgi:hypothetical protein